MSAMLRRRPNSASHRNGAMRQTATSKLGTTRCCISKLGPSAVRRPVPLAEPGAVFRHLCALRLRRMTLACRGLFAGLKRAPPKLHAVVGVVGHLEIHGTIDHILDRQRPLRAVAAGIGYLARGKFRIK